MFVFIVFVVAAGSVLGSAHETLIGRSKRQTQACEFVCTASNNACMERATGCGSSWECHYTTDDMFSNCDCGLADKYYSLIPGVAEDASRSATPWHVGIYQKRTSTFYPQLCTGVLIFKDVVITTAACMFDPQTLQKLEPSAIKVAAKQSRDYFLEDVGEQKFDVAIVKILDGYEGDFRGFSKNVALLFLATPASRPGIHPICLYTKKTMPPEMPYLKLTGWGLVPLSNYSRTKTVKHSIVDIYDIYTCIGKYGTPLNRKVLTNDKFCVQFTEDTNMSEEDSGGPTCLLWKDRHHLVGILSNKLKTDQQFGIATRLYRYLPWIYHQVKMTRRELTCHNLSNAFRCGQDMGCVPLTKVCDGNIDCPNGADEDDRQCTITTGGEGRCLIPDGIEVYSREDCQEGRSCKVSRYAVNGAKYIVTCPEGYSFSMPGPKKTLCFEESWNPPPPPCYKQCQPVTSNTLDLTCQYLGTEVSCDSLLLPNTTINFTCKRAFKQDPAAKYRSPTHCRGDGELLYLLTNCIPQCGYLQEAEKLQPLISHGQEAKAGSYPWMAALYWREDGTFKHKCGGTIIATNKVLTAAHCLYRGKELLVPDEDLRVATGKYRRQWQFEDEFEQRFEVKRKVIGTHYNGISGSYAQDIAVLVLTTHIKLNAFNAPACLDLNNLAGSTLKQKIGYVAGWGYQEDGIQPTNLRETAVGYLDLEDCRKQFQQSSKFFTADKFCAIFLNGSATEMGDSGGGLTFIRDGLHYVYGIVSIKVKERNDVAGFTNIITHAQWLKNVMSLDD